MIKWGSRGSPLAMTQSQTVAAKLARLTGEAEAPIESFITSGDRIADRRLQDAGGKGLSPRNWMKPCWSDASTPPFIP